MTDEEKSRIIIQLHNIQSETVQSKADYPAQCPIRTIRCMDLEQVGLLKGTADGKKFYNPEEFDICQEGIRFYNDSFVCIPSLVCPDIERVQTHILFGFDQVGEEEKERLGKSWKIQELRAAFWESIPMYSYLNAKYRVEDRHSILRLCVDSPGCYEIQQILIYSLILKTLSYLDSGEPDKERWGKEVFKLVTELNQLTDSYSPISEISEIDHAYRTCSRKMKESRVLEIEGRKIEKYREKFLIKEAEELSGTFLFSPNDLKASILSKSYQILARMVQTLTSGKTMLPIEKFISVTKQMDIPAYDKILEVLSEAFLSDDNKREFLKMLKEVYEKTFYLPEDEIKSMVEAFQSRYKIIVT